ncbi:MAG: hypothetical protein GJ680_01520 [Alteromonadaceae bacterium]|nr:hypothetical protein [Alteromonadaceae bacterium]
MNPRSKAGGMNQVPRQPAVKTPAPPQRQNATRNINAGAGAHLTRQDATTNVHAGAGPALTRQDASTNVLGRDSKAGQANMNSMMPKAGPRPQTQSAKPAMTNSPRQGNKALDSIGAAATQRLDTAIKAGPGKMHEKSTKRLHKERAFIYDQSKRGATMQKINANKPNMKVSLKGINKDVISKEDRQSLTEEARGLKAYQKRIKEKNPTAAKREKIGSTAKKAKKVAKYADYAGTAVSFVNPAAGAGVKIGAKATKIAAAAGATTAYHFAARAYDKNVDDSAQGDAMFDSHIAKEKASMMRNTRNKMGVGLAASIVGAGISAGMDEAMENVADNVANKVTAGYDLVKRQAKEEIKKPFKEKIRENKSELVNLMQIQKSRADYAKRKEKMDAAIANRQMANMANKK